MYAVVYTQNNVLTPADVTHVLILCLLTYSMAATLRVGLFSIAPAGFAGIGAYVAGLLMVKSHWPFAAALPAAALVCALGGALLSIPLARISGIYTSIATLAFVVVATGVENTLPITGGSLGLIGIRHLDLRWPLAATLAAVLGIAYWLEGSSLGRRLDVTGEDPVLATVLGIRIGLLRSLAIVASALIAGWAGAIYAASFYVVTPADFNFFFAITIAAYTVVGGVTFWCGPLLGSLFLGYLNVQLRDLANWGQVVTGAAMVVTIVLAPDGLAGPLRKRFRARLGSPAVPGRIVKVAPESVP